MGVRIEPNLNIKLGSSVLVPQTATSLDITSFIQMHIAAGNSLFAVHLEAKDEWDVHQEASITFTAPCDLYVTTLSFSDFINYTTYALFRFTTQPSTYFEIACPYNSNSFIKFSSNIVKLVRQGEKYTDYISYDSDSESSQDDRRSMYIILTGTPYLASVG